VLVVPGCPHRAVTIAHLREALARGGHADVAVIERMVSDLAEAAAFRMRGSPTVLVDGRDLFDGDAEPSLSCRLYPGEHGLRGSPSVEALVAALREVAATARAREAGVVGFVALWHGEQPLISELDIEDSTVEALVEAGRLELDHDHRLVGVHGLVARRSAHRVEHAGGVVHTWCALDAIGIPAALGIDARALTSCPTCGATLAVELDDGVPVPACPSDYRLWLPTGPCAHMVEDFCRHANLYCSDEHLAEGRWLGQGGAVTVAEAAAMGREAWRAAAAALRDLDDLG